MNGFIRQFKYQGKDLEQIFKKVDYNFDSGKATLLLSFDRDDIDKEEIKKELEAFLLNDPEIDTTDISFTDFREHEKALNSVLNRDDVLYILVSSGKGGVGKSSVSANLAVQFKDKGYKVALIDCDIYGSSIPNIFGVDSYVPRVKDNILEAAHVDGIDIVSVDFLVDADKPIVWRGPMLNRALGHFFYYTKYSEGVNVVIVDLPPGTGDIPLDLVKIIPQAFQLVVTTPDLNAAAIAIKAGEMAKQMKHTTLGVIENMSYYDHKGERINVFGQGGGQQVADKLDVPLLAQIQIDKPNNGSTYTKDENNYSIYSELVDKIIKNSQS